MPVQKTILPDHSMVYSDWFGEIHADDIIAAEVQYSSMEGYSADQTYIVDLRRVEHAAISMSEVQRILNLVQARHEEADRDRKTNVRAVVLAPNDLTFGMTRQFQAVADARGGVSIKIFRDEESLASEIGQPGRALDEFVQTEGIH